MEDHPEKDVPEWAQWYLAAFEAIRDDRNQIEGGIGHLWFSSIKAWADHYGVGLDDFPMFHRMIHELDIEYIAVVSEHIAEMLAKAKSETPTGPP